MASLNTAPSKPDAAPAATAAPRRRRRLDLHERPELILVPAVFVVVVLAWQFLTVPLGIKEYVLPRPTQILDAFVAQLGSPAFWSNVRVTVTEALTGFVIAAVGAVLVGTFVAQVRVVERTVMPYVVAIQTIPKVAIAPLMVVWFGFGAESKIIMAAVIAFFPVLVNVIAGLKSADADKVEMLTSFGASKFQIFRMVRLPSALPFIFAGLDIGVVFSILGAIVGEFIGAKEGLGYQLLQANYNFDIPGLFAVLLALSVLGIVAHLIVRYANRRIVFWNSGDRGGAH
ncbi:ABC transporter permease [Microbispora amethystogenes]|uniref:ABC transporter permease n=1 Tax=Microbispora amethystogenes TaxID=1427754 RepID=UPI0033D59DB6